MKCNIVLVLQNEIFGPLSRELAERDVSSVVFSEQFFVFPTKRIFQLACRSDARRLPHSRLTKPACDFSPHHLLKIIIVTVVVENPAGSQQK